MHTTDDMLIEILRFIEDIVLSPEATCGTKVTTFSLRAADFT